ncbi:MAG: hypothetical protein ACFBSE_18485 [Prochloraceae cyanobacterium]
MGEYLYRKDTFDKSVVSQTKNEFTNVESSQPKTELSPSESEWEEMITEAEYLRYRKENGRTLTPDQEQKLQFITEMLRQQRREALREFRAANGLSNKQIVANQAETPLETGGSKENSNTKEDTDKKNPILESLNYIWGTVIGDWNNQQDPAQILVNTGVGLIPIADQVLDFRDFTAHLYYMVFQKDYQDPMRWLALGLTAVGAIPFVGSIIKGLGKIALFSDATKAIGKSAEPLLQQIRQINPEWADIGKLRAAIEQNWDSGVATSKQVWMNLLASVKSQISGVPLPPDFIWGVDKLAGAKQDLLGTISEIQQLSNKMLDDALERIRNEIDIILRELDRIAKEKLGQPELVPEAVGDKVGAYNRTSVEPPQKVEPNRMTGTPSSSPKIEKLKNDLGVSLFNKLTLDLTEKEIDDLVTNYGVDVIKWLGKDLSGNNVKDILSRLNSSAVNSLKNISGKQAKELLEELGDDVLNILASPLKGKGLDELRQFGMFNFDAAKQALLTGGQGTACRNLPPLKGKTRGDVETALTAAGFSPPTEARISGMEIWTHIDGSVVRMKVGPNAIKPPRTVEHFVKEISKKPGKFGNRDIFAKVADNGAVVPAGTNFAEDQLSQWFRKKTGTKPSATEVKILMDVWGNSTHIDILP